MQKITAFLSKYFIFFLAGSITALSQAPFNFFFLSIIGFSLFFYLVIKSENIHYFWAGHSFGFGYFLVSLCWVGNALLSDTSQFGIFLPFAYLGLPFALASFYGLGLWIYKIIIHFNIGKNNNYTVHKYVLLMLVLGLSDYIRGYIFTGFPWNLPVYTTAYMNILMQPSYLLGIYWYNFLWVSFASSFGLYFVKTKFKLGRLISLQILFCIFVLGYGYWHIHYDNTQNQKIISDDKTIIRIIQPNIEQKLKWSKQEAQNNFKKLIDLSVKNLNPNLKYIFVWPETAMPFNPEYDKSIASQIINLLDNKHILVSGKMRYAEQERQTGKYNFYNSMFKFSPDGTIEPVFDKVHLVPFGEYLPLRFILDKIGFSQINFFKSEFSAGKNFTPFVLTDSIKAAGLICYEAIFPQYSKAIKNNQADVIINVTNDAWFGNSFGPYQHLTQTQFRAVENGIPIIRSANTGISGFIDKNGMLVNSLNLDEAGFVDIFLSNFLK